MQLWIRLDLNQEERGGDVPTGDDLREEVACQAADIDIEGWAVTDATVAEAPTGKVKKGCKFDAGGLAQALLGDLGDLESGGTPLSDLNPRPFPGAGPGEWTFGRCLRERVWLLIDMLGLPVLAKREKD